MGSGRDRPLRHQVRARSLLRYRRFGTSELEVSEVGFGTWTLASDWWGVVENKQEMLHAALDAGINFIDTAPVYGNDGVGETLLADVLKTNRDEIVLTTKCGYDIDAARMFPGQSERPQDWEPAIDPPAARRTRCAGSAPTTSTCTSSTTRASSRSSTTTCGRCSSSSATRARCASSASRSARRSAGSRKGSSRSGGARSRRCRPSSTSSSRSRASRSRSEIREQGEDIGLISRVPHASDTLSGKVTPRHRVPAGGPPLAPQPRQHARQLRQGRHAGVPLGGHRPHAGARRRSPASSPTRRSRPCCRPCVDVDDVREYAAAVDMPLTADEVAQVDELWRENFGIENRYEMPLKSSH